MALKQIDCYLALYKRVVEPKHVSLVASQLKYLHLYIQRTNAVILKMCYINKQIVLKTSQKCNNSIIFNYFKQFVINVDILFLIIKPCGEAKAAGLFQTLFDKTEHKSNSQPRYKAVKLAPPLIAGSILARLKSKSTTNQD